MSDELPPRLVAAKILKDGIERRRQKAESSFAAPLGSASWHWSLRNFETPVTRLCVDCGVNVPETGNICDECREDAIND